MPDAFEQRPSNDSSMNQRTGIGALAIVLITVVAAIGSGENGGSGLVHTISTLGANSYLLKGEDGWILVDTGMKGSAKGLKNAFSRLGVDPRSIKLIVITHAHLDHFGELANLKRLTGAKVLAHRYEASFIESGGNSPIVARTTLGRLINAIAPKLRMEGSTVEVVFDDELDLAGFGADGKVVCTPGHTAGSLSIVLKDGSVLVGDQFRGKAGRLTLGMFYEDEQKLRASLRRIVGFGPKVLYMSHGATTDLADLEGFVNALR